MFHHQVVQMWNSLLGHANWDSLYKEYLAVLTILTLIQSADHGQKNI